jgi:hypothetical protein
MQAAKCLPIDSYEGESQSLVKSMHKQKARALAHEPCECVGALDQPALIGIDETQKS